MSKIKKPQKKKALSYAKDKRYYSESKTFRKRWPKKKKRINRDVRHKVNLVLGRVGVASEDETALRLGGIEKEIKGEKLEKWGVDPLGKHVAERLVKRQSRINSHKMRRARLKTKFKLE